VAHGPEAGRDSSLYFNKESGSDIEPANYEAHGFEDTILTQVIGVAILEFGVVLHR
jgi:zinc transporter 1/2/3